MGTLIKNGILYSGSGGSNDHIWTTPVTASAGATSVTIQNANIHTTSTIEPFADNGTNQAMSMPTMTVTEGQCVLSFPALSADTSFKLRVTN